MIVNARHLSLRLLARLPGLLLCRGHSRNDLTLEATKNRERQTAQDFTSKETTSAAGILIQQAAENKAKVMADAARRNIEEHDLFR